MDVRYLTTGERLIRVHRFRYVRPAGCALAAGDILVEETLGEIRGGSPRCMARPDHPELVTRPEFVVPGEGVEAVLKALIEKIRPRQFYELFFPKG
ncbi:MAG: hypothetical protein HY347_08470 [candidate division NC10 bacterium]|nr:hypothetical protein [candidate division NC10 bacterium]